MINKSVQFLAEEINKYLDLKLPVGDTNLIVVAGNIPFAAGSTAPIPELNNKVVLTLVNVEEDKIARQQVSYVNTTSDIVYKSPPLHINYYLLFSMNRINYDECLDYLSKIMIFFQEQNVFTPETHPSLNASIQKLMVELHNVNFEEANHLWSMLGSRYLPSVLYKVRQVTID